MQADGKTAPVQADSKCVQAEGNLGKTVKTVRQASCLLHNAFQASSCQSISLQQILSSTSVFSYMMPSKPVAAKASVFKLPKQLSSTAT